MNTRPEPLKTETVDRMAVRVYGDRETMGRAAGLDVARRIRDTLSRQDNVRMVFAAAPSQAGVLSTLAGEENIDWSRVTAFHMDEYAGLSRADPRSFGRFLGDALFDAVKPGVVHLIEGMRDPAEECGRYTEVLLENPIDIVCLGIGENGHIAFNDPPVADFEDPQAMKPVELDEASRHQQVNDGMFPSIDDVPTHALTLTVPSLMSGAHLICAVPGATKRGAVECALRGPVTTDCPASVLRRHPDCVFYTDKEAYGDGGAP